MGICTTCRIGSRTCPDSADGSERRQDVDEQAPPPSRGIGIYTTCSIGSRTCLDSADGSERWQGVDEQAPPPLRGRGWGEGARSGRSAGGSPSPPAPLPQGARGDRSPSIDWSIHPVRGTADLCRYQCSRGRGWGEGARSGRSAGVSPSPPTPLPQGERGDQRPGVDRSIPPARGTADLCRYLCLVGEGPDQTDLAGLSAPALQTTFLSPSQVTKGLSALGFTRRCGSLRALRMSSRPLAQCSRIVAGPNW